MSHPPLLTRPRADTRTVEDLLEFVKAGQIRRPDFQRALRWRAKHVLALFDSLWLGYPVGSLLLWQRPGGEATMTFGSYRVTAAARSDALFVVDGQQRINALAGVLLHPSPSSSPSDLFSLWFDLEAQSFVRPSPNAPVAPHWIPINRVFDAVELGAWLVANDHLTHRPDLQRVAHQVGRRIREYRIPVYTVEFPDAAPLKVIFGRLNTAGVAMRETEVFTALHTDDGQIPPLEQLAEAVRDARMGALDEGWRLRCLRTVAGDTLDARSSTTVSGYEEYVPQALTAVGLALDFLRDDCHIPHLRLLPFRLPIVVLTAFFHHHPEAGRRTRILLRRWLWRGIVNEHHKNTQNQQLRFVSKVVTTDERATVKTLLKDCGSVDDARIRTYAESVAKGYSSFNAAQAKVYGTLLASACPRHLSTGEALDIGQLLEESGPDAVPLVGPARRDRILHPYLDHKAAALDEASGEIQRSHLWVQGGSSGPARAARLTAFFQSALTSWCEPGLPDFFALPTDDEPEEE